MSNGAPVRFSDRKESDKIQDAIRAKDYRAKDLLLALIRSPIFQGQP